MVRLIAAAAFVQALPDETFSHQIISNLPTDPASLVTLGLFFIAFVAVVWSGRSKGKGGESTAPPKDVR